jgi:hypothetical protein
MIATRNFFITNPFQGIEDAPVRMRVGRAGGGLGVFLYVGEARVLRAEFGIAIGRPAHHGAQGGSNSLPALSARSSSAVVEQQGTLVATEWLLILGGLL